MKKSDYKGRYFLAFFFTNLVWSDSWREHLVPCSVKLRRNCCCLLQRRSWTTASDCCSKAQETVWTTTRRSSVNPMSAERWGAPVGQCQRSAASTTDFWEQICHIMCRLLCSFCVLWVFGGFFPWPCPSQRPPHLCITVKRALNNSCNKASTFLDIAQVPTLCCPNSWWKATAHFIHPSVQKLRQSDLI